eukprot:SAG31_NODE_5862_length_2285_cov_1.425435_2_plen_90_part_00
MGGKEGGGDVTAEVMLTCVGQHGNITAYRIDVFTGDKFGAGTDAKVQIRLYGKVILVAFTGCLHAILSIFDDVIYSVAHGFNRYGTRVG